MNFSRYASLYSRFHGATSYRTEQDIIILDMIEEPFDNWILLRMFRFDDILTRPENTFAKALQMHLQSQAPLTVFCQSDTWIALSGRDKYITPIVAEHANFQMYATPYFVRNPSTLADYMPEHHSDTVFRYRNSIVYLDRHDLPYPGGCYFNPSTTSPSALYRICVLSREPHDKALQVASEWKTRRDIVTLPFPTTDAISIPAAIRFQPIAPPYLPNERVLSSGNVQKRLSLHQPQCLIQDILMSYQRNVKPVVIQNVGLVMEWPFRVSFEGTRSNTSDTSGGALKQFVALTVNGYRPTRILLVRYPYEVYTEYNEVPAIPYFMIQFTSGILELPPEMEKVSVDSTVIGYKYENGFYCFSFPVLEGRPTSDRSRNVDCLFNVPKKSHPDDQVKFTFQVDDKCVVHRMDTKTGVFHGWCLRRMDEARLHPAETGGSLPTLVHEWLKLFQLHDKTAQPIDVKMLQMALTLARHKICFKTNRGAANKKSLNQIQVTDSDIVISSHSAEEIQFINNCRADVGLDWEGEREEESANSCHIM